MASRGWLDKGGISEVSGMKLAYVVYIVHFY